MMKSGIDQQALIDLFANASAQQTAQLREAVFKTTLGALQGRELSLKNIRTVLGTVAQAAGTGAAQNPLGNVDAEALLDNAVAGMDDALIKAVEANRVALQQFVDKGVDLRETQLKKALADMDKFEDALIGTLKKSAAAVGDPMAGPWAAVLEKLNLSGTQTGLKASGAAEQLTAQMEQMQSAMRATRAASLKAAQTLADSYTALVSGVLIGMSDAMRQVAAPAKKSTKK
ncbi:DUF6781 family protein [Pseudaquabacterium pictum]|uniref:Uncharacterized protein n=1 Tax=Pseudaquabacterium pictum TaxID=2315236 RepID=A0A480AX05_9BURK|nr:DUF6781 family protein [Rubrivivax pictus]GCL66014.1 hypothetical protein AQPW35_50950 [Rubrivivax pictus]